MSISGARVLNLTLWVLQGALVLAFLFFGATKFDPHQMFWIDLFAKVGWGQWFRYFTGALEMVCAVLLMIPKTSTIGAALLAGTMIGAMLAHFFVLHEPAIVNFLPAAFLLILIVVMWKRRTVSLAWRRK
jgi:putative oxidoreductase